LFDFSIVIFGRGYKITYWKEKRNSARIYSLKIFVQRPVTLANTDARRQHHTENGNVD
jgi:hypothetical protein